MTATTKASLQGGETNLRVTETFIADEAISLGFGSTTVRLPRGI
jgi:hypothetical protein